jgi:hypothetical protein
LHRQEEVELGRGEGSRAKGGALILLARKTGGKPESNATISIPCRIIAYREGKEDRNHGIHKHENGIQRGEARGRNHYFGDAKAVRCRNCQIGSSRTGTPTLRSGGTTSTRNRNLVLCAVLLFTLFFHHAGKLAFEEREVRGVKSGEEGRQVFADAMQEGSCSHTRNVAWQG